MAKNQGRGQKLQQLEPFCTRCPHFTVVIFSGHVCRVQKFTVPVPIYGADVHMCKAEIFDVFFCGVLSVWSSGLTLFQYLTCSVVLQALGASDYLEMARLFDTVLIRRVPMLTLSMKDQARRFTTLIDNFYDKKVKTKKKRMKGMDSITLMCYRRISNAAFLPLFTTFRNLPTLHP